MYLLQCLIMFSVVESNHRWHWAHGYVPVLFSWLLAYGVTFLVVEFRDRWHRFGWSKRLIFPGR
jgi:hypothetical protein